MPCSSCRRTSTDSPPEDAGDVIAAYNPHRPRPDNVDGLTKVLRQRDDGRWVWRWDPAFITSKDRCHARRPREQRTTFPADGRTAARRCPTHHRPTLLVRGAMSDLVSPDTVDEFLTAVPHATAVDVSNTGHNDVHHRRLRLPRPHPPTQTGPHTMTHHPPDDAVLLDPVDPHTDDEAVADARQRRLILITMCVSLIAVIAPSNGAQRRPTGTCVDIGATAVRTVVDHQRLHPRPRRTSHAHRRASVTAGAANPSSSADLSCSPPPTSPAARQHTRTTHRARIVAGIAAAMIMPVTLSVITTSFPAAERAKAIGTRAGVAGAGGILGLFASAAIIDNATWPWVALRARHPRHQAPLVATLFVVPHSREHIETGFDIAGAVLSVLAVGGLVLAVQEGPEQGWTATITIIGFVGVAAAIGFVLGRAPPRPPCSTCDCSATKGSPPDRSTCSWCSP